MRRIEKEGRAAFSQPGFGEAYVRHHFGLSMEDLSRHLGILNGLAAHGGSISKSDRTWLLQQAHAAGRDVQRAARDIDSLANIQNPEARARAYVRGSAGDVDERFVDYAMNLGKTYARESGASAIGDRLAENDRQLQRQSLPDTPRLKESRESAGSMRREIEGALKDAGLVEREPATLEEAQHEARRYASEVADYLEHVSTPRDGDDDEGPDLREALKTNWHVAEAFSKLHDVGLSQESIGSVNEATEAKLFAARNS